MAANCNGFRVVASQECDGRQLDFTLAAEQAIFGLIPTTIFLIATGLRLLSLSRQHIKAVDGVTRKVKQVCTIPMANSKRFSLTIAPR